MSGLIFYRGPSMLTGDPVVGIATGLSGESLNPKTGPMVQTWVLRSDMAPMDAKRQGLDDAICGDCKLRGDGGRASGCYVTPWQAPTNVFKVFQDGGYLEPSWSEIQAVLEARAIRLCAYGDPCALPFEVCRMLLATASTWTAYSHQWRGADPRFKTIVMASVDTVDEFIAAGLGGWRTFRILWPGEAPIAGGEFRCPASDEMQHRSSCQRCRLCRGTSSPARSVAIAAHGKPSSLRMFTRRSESHQKATAPA